VSKLDLSDKTVALAEGVFNPIMYAALAMRTRRALEVR
jgi:hypothetical protein